MRPSSPPRRRRRRTRSSSSRATAPTTRRVNGAAGRVAVRLRSGRRCERLPARARAAARSAPRPRVDRRGAGERPDALDHARPRQRPALPLLGRASASTARPSARVDGRGATPDGRRASNLVFGLTVARIARRAPPSHGARSSRSTGYGRAAFVFVANGASVHLCGPRPVHARRATPSSNAGSTSSRRASCGRAACRGCSCTCSAARARRRDGARRSRPRPDRGALRPAAAAAGRRRGPRRRRGRVRGRADAFCRLGACDRR